MTQPITTVGNSQAIAATDFDNLPPDELAKLINAAHQVKTGRSGRVSPSQPVQSTGQFIDYDAKFGR